MDEPKPHIYEFGDFRLDAAKRLLLRGGEPVPLTPKVFDTLLYLVQHGGTVLTKDELMAAIWPDTVVEENNLGQNISRLRVVLGESRGQNRYIATVPGCGYRFVADVKGSTGDTLTREPVSRSALHLGNETEVGAVSDFPQSTRGAGKKGSFLVALLAGIIVSGLGVAGAYLWRARTRTDSGLPVRTIAVLPFKSLVVENRDEALELGMADTLISKLSSIKELTVRPLSVVRRYGDPEQDPFAAGRELGVEAVLDGQIQRWGDHVRVTARLVRVDDEKQLWAGQFDERFTNIFAVQDSISAQVAGELAPRLTGEERERLAKSYTTDAEAYQLYLKGRFFRDKRTREGTSRAIEYFRQALGRDPTYALAYAGLADCYRGLPIQSDVPSREAFPKAKEAVLKALEIDDQLAEAHTTLAWIKFWYDWDWGGAEKEYQRALEINPDSPSAHIGYGHLLSSLGRHEEALGEADRALKLEPLSSFNGAMKGQFLFHAGRYPQAIDQLQKTLEIEPNFWIGQLLLGRSYEREGRYEEALEAFRKARESGGTSVSLSFTGYTYAAAGRRGEAERTLRELRSLSEQTYVPPYNMALVYNGLGDSTEAVRWLERAYNERDVRMVFLGVDPLWDSLRSHPVFSGLLDRMRLHK